jgi:AcrR family transcriptional regulator
MTEYSGTGDPARSIALLWRTSERTSRKGKPDLSVDRIAQAAIALADAQGLPALSMRRVAEQLGVGTMSLYTYVPGKAELIDVMLDTVYGETARPSSVEGGWRGHLEQVARENWALAMRHPWMLQIVTVRPVLGPQQTEKYEYELRALEGIGLTDVEMDAALAVVLGHVQTSALGALSHAEVSKRTGMSDDEWWAQSAPVLDRLMPADSEVRYPIAARVGQAVGGYDPEHTFEFGLRTILDGIEALVASRQ